MTSRVRIIGTGSFLPPFEVDNETICKYYPRKDARWVEEKLGILTRRFAFDFEQNRMRPGYYDSEMALAAARRALEAAGIEANDLDLVIRVSCTPDYLHFFPDPAAERIQKELGATLDCASFAIPAGCSGFVYAMEIARSLMLGNQRYQKVLISVSNSVSPFMDVENRVSEDWCRKNAFDAYIFGDGAGAVVLEKQEIQDEDEAGIGILDGYLGSWYERNPITYPAGGGASPTRVENVPEHFYKMDLRAVAEEAPRHLQQAIMGLMKIRGFALEETSRFFEKIDWFLFHQANMQLLDGFAEMTGIPKEKILRNGDRYGNTSAASTVILLDEAVREGKIKAGDLLLFAVIGAGGSSWQYGSLLVRW
jgi:3-oxoacyl-[acyl-carrier-protein] synthase-3